jgi:hypothetical protein
MRINLGFNQHIPVSCESLLEVNERRGPQQQQAVDFAVQQFEEREKG